MHRVLLGGEGLWCTVHGWLISGRELYDQGGLVFILPKPGSDIKESKWIKTGIEFYQGSAYVSTVVKDRSADWSLAQTNIKNGKEVTLLVERHEKDDTLWIYAVDGENKAPLREVTWILSEDGDSEVWVGVYAARPMPGGDLEVKFEAFELQLLWEFLACVHKAIIANKNKYEKRRF